jgi:sugar lactone lactonase YvrE
MTLEMGLAPLKAQPPAITHQPASQSVRPGATVIFTVGVVGGGPFDYQWQCNGTNLPNGIITTVAGRDPKLRAKVGRSGDGGPAISASLINPTGIAVDAFENLFIGQASDPHVEASVRKVDTNGIIRTIEGARGTGGVSIALATDAAGNLYVAGQADEKVHKVDTKGKVSTVAGSWSYGNFAGDSGNSGDGGPATRAQFHGPFGLALDSSGNLFIADCYNQRVRKVSAQGIITTVAGNGRQGYSGDGRAATDAQLYWPKGLAVDASGNLFIVDTGNNRIRKVRTNGIITTVAGGGTASEQSSGPATNASLYTLSGGVALDSPGNLFIADCYKQLVLKVSAQGIITTVAGNGRQGYSGDGGSATNARLFFPQGLALDGYGNLFVADMCGQIRKVGNTQGPVLVLNNVTAGNAGNYLVVVTGHGGSVTSSVATLAVGD